MQRTDEVCRKIEATLADSPGVQYVTTTIGSSLLSGVQSTYSGFFFVTLKPWGDRRQKSELYPEIKSRLNRLLVQMPQGIAFAFSPPAIPGAGTSGDITFVLEDRSGGDPDLLSTNVTAFLNAARKRPELAQLNTTFQPSVPQVYIDVDLERALKQGVAVSDIYQTIQTFMGGSFVNYFNRFGREWQVYVQAEGEYRANLENLGQFYVRNGSQQMVPLSGLTRIESRTGPEFTMRYNLYGCAQINATPATGYSYHKRCTRWKKSLRQRCLPRWVTITRDVVPGEIGSKRGAACHDFWFFVAVCLPDPGSALRKLVASFQCAAKYSDRGFRRFRYALSAKYCYRILFCSDREQRLCPNWISDDHWISREERDSNRRVCPTEFERGTQLVEAALTGARLRLRPILMTSFAFILGCVSFWAASGSGVIAL